MGTGPGQNGSMTGDSFFDSIRRFEITRPDDAPMAGVSTALAKHWNVDPLLIRAAFIVLAFFGGIGIALYTLGWMLLPDHEGRIHAQEPFYGKLSPSLVLGVLLMLLALSGGRVFGHGWAFISIGSIVATIITIGFIVWLVIYLTNSGKRANQQHSPQGNHGNTDPFTWQTTHEQGYSESMSGSPAFSTQGQDSWFGMKENGANPSNSAWQGPPDPTDRYCAADGGAAGTQFAGTDQQPSSPLQAQPTAQQTGCAPDRSALYSDIGTEDRPAASGRAVLLALAFMLLAGAGLTFLIDSGMTSLSNTNLLLTGFAIVTLVFGLVVIAYGATGRRGGGISLLAIMLAVLTIPIGLVATFPHNEHHVFMGEGSWAPTSQAQVEGDFSFVMGTMDIDITDLEEGSFDVVGRMGELTLTVSDDQKIAIITDFAMADIPPNGTGNISNNSLSGEQVFYVGDIDSVADADIVINADILMSTLTIERSK